MKKIIYINWGGLGDHLQFSTLPEKFTNMGYDVYISDKSLYRNSEIYDLVWGQNPYVKGISTDTPNCGHLPNWGFGDRVVEFNKNNSIHKNIEILYGIEDNSDYPIIYYKPSKINDYRNKTIIDLNTFSVMGYNVNKIKQILNFLGNKKTIVIKPNNYAKHIIDDDFYLGLNVDLIETKSIFNYMDIIFSSDKFYCLWSGSSVLSAAIKKHFNNELEINCFKQIEDSNNFGTSDKSFFWYDNINYIFI